jgi:hypothetical protein
MATEYHEESIFNMAFAYLQRIDKLLYIAGMASMQGDIQTWSKCLNNLFRELSIKLTPEELLEMKGDDKDLEHIRKNLNDCSNLMCMNKFCNSPMYSRKYRKECLSLLSELEMKIRIKMQKKGMLLPSKDDPRRAITDR